MYVAIIESCHPKIMMKLELKVDEIQIIYGKSLKVFPKYFYHTHKNGDMVERRNKKWCINVFFSLEAVMNFLLAQRINVE